MTDDYLKRVEEIHDLAMTYCDQHDIFPNPFALKLAAQAETNAAAMMYHRDEQPSRAILFRSAATLQQRIGNIPLARMLADIGLQRNPPEWVVEEFTELLREMEEE